MVKHVSHAEFEKFVLSDDDVLDNPFRQFTQWWNDTVSAGVPMVDAAHLATVDEHHHPDVRVVFIKNFDEKGLVFFTNYQSKKAEQLAHNPHAALNLFWPELERQIRIKGQVAKTSREESKIYFDSRPRGAQIGAWASPQSQVVKDRAQLEKNYADQSTHFMDREIPCPPHWGGFCLVPSYFEFWQGRSNRLHDRFCFVVDDAGKWIRQRLAP